MIDRFGLLGNEIKNLFRTTQLKLAAEKCGIKKIEAGDNGGLFEFSEKTSINPLELVKLVQTQADIYRLSGSSTPRFNIALSNHEQRFQFVEELTDKLSQSSQH